MRIFKSVIVTAVLFIMIAPSCKKNQEEKTTINLDLLKAQHWYFSGEETSGDTIYYRPETYEFPFSRGREGFKLKDDGTVIYHAISPTDFPMKFDNAKWSYNNEVLTINIPGNQFAQPRTLEYRILSLNEERLKGIAIY